MGKFFLFQIWTNQEILSMLIFFQKKLHFFVNRWRCTITPLAPLVANPRGCSGCVKYNYALAKVFHRFFGLNHAPWNCPRLWSSKSKMSVPTHGCCRAILYFTNPNKILPSKMKRGNDWGLDDHDLRAILSRADGTKVRAQK